MTRIALRPATPDTEVSAEPIEMLAASSQRADYGRRRLGVRRRRGWRVRSWPPRRLDTLELCVVPILIGDGIALFGPGTPQSNLPATTSRRYANGPGAARIMSPAR